MLVIKNPEVFDAVQFIKGKGLPNVESKIDITDSANDYVKTGTWSTRINDGDWILTDQSGNSFVVSNDAFLKLYAKQPATIITI